MIRSVFASASGLRAHQEMLDVVGNNLSNINTPGFKTQRIRFSNLFSQVLRAQSGPTDDSGGRNPLQIGLGVETAAVDTQFTQGTYESTGNPYDLAIQDSGFFLVRDNDRLLVTRSGAFTVDANHYLVDASTGYRVQRVGGVGEGTSTAPAFQVQGDNDIVIPKGVTIPGRATTQLTLRGNLNAQADSPLATVLMSGSPYTTNGAPALLTTRLNDLDQTTSPYQAGDQIQILGTRVDGSPVETVYTATGTDEDTLGALVTLLNTHFLSATPGIGATASLNASGNLLLTANQPGPSSLNMSVFSSNSDASLSTGITDFSTFRKAVEGRDGGSTSTVMEIFDDQFGAHNLSLTFRKVSSNRWDLTASLDDQIASIKGEGEDNFVSGLLFNEDGSFSGVLGSATLQSLALGTPLTASNQAVTLATPLDSLDQHTGGAYTAADQIMITGTERNGLAVAPIAFSPEGKTVGDLIDAINAAFDTATASLDASGNIILQSDLLGQSELSLQLSDPGTNVARTTFGDFGEIVRGTDGDADITFEINELANFGSKQMIRLSFGSANGFDGLTQFGGFTTASAVEQDGFAQGVLVSEEVQQDGTIIGQFSNGQANAIAQLALATFANPQGLDRVGNNYFAQTASSGAAVITAALSGAAGSIQSGALESSNVDVGLEFTQLISAQRGFQVNARAFSIANQVLEETANLLR